MLKDLCLQSELSTVCGLGRGLLWSVFLWDGRDGLGFSLLSMHRLTQCECSIWEPAVSSQPLRWELGATIC